MRNIAEEINSIRERVAMASVGFDEELGINVDNLPVCGVCNRTFAKGWYSAYNQKRGKPYIFFYTCRKCAHRKKRKARAEIARMIFTGLIK